MHQHTQTVVPADVGHWIAELEALLAESPQEAAADDETAGDMLERLGMDGKLWADEFCKRTGFGDRDLAHGWFCNAIMAGYDEAARQERVARSAQEAAPSSGWQPIATAPKDVKPFIAANHMDAFRAFYDTDEDCQVFTAEDSGLWFGQMEHPPTHWMPLPPR